jgi:hypothetical protein
MAVQNYNRQQSIHVTVYASNAAVNAAQQDPAIETDEFETGIDAVDAHFDGLAGMNDFIYDPDFQQEFGTDPILWDMDWMDSETNAFDLTLEDLATLDRPRD